MQAAREEGTNPSPEDSRHTEFSAYREHLVEHLFMAELLQAAWLRRQPLVEVMRSEVDMYGYDLVLARGSVVRHVQLKASTHNTKTAFQKVNIRLAEKPAGCLIWVLRESPPCEGQCGGW